MSSSLSVFTVGCNLQFAPGFITFISATYVIIDSPTTDLLSILTATNFIVYSPCCYRDFYWPIPTDCVSVISKEILWSASSTFPSCQGFIWLHVYCLRFPAYSHERKQKKEDNQQPAKAEVICYIWKGYVTNSLMTGYCRLPVCCREWYIGS